MKIKTYGTMNATNVEGNSYFTFVAFIVLCRFARIW